MEAGLKIVHSSDLSNDDHLKGLSPDKIRIIRNLASIYVNSIVKEADEILEQQAKK